MDNPNAKHSADARITDNHTAKSSDNRLNSQVGLPNMDISKGASITKLRSSNFELLRIVCILFIIAGHMWLGHNWDDTPSDRFIHNGLHPLFTVAVNCFILISGWFGIKYNARKLLKLSGMVWFWTYILGALAVIAGIYAPVVSDFIMMFPIITKRYWFVTIYIVLCLLAPFLNILVEKLDKQQFKRLLLICFVLFVFLSTATGVIGLSSITGDGGYGIINFMFLYLLGRYMRLHYTSKISKWADLALYFGCTLACGAYQFINAQFINGKIISLFNNISGRYDTLTAFFGAVGLFMFFSKVKLTSRLINWMATFCLATYVIHLHPWIYMWLYQDFLGGNNIHGIAYLGFIVVIPFVTFAACIILEWLRQRLFHLLHLE